MTKINKRKKEKKEREKRKKEYPDRGTIDLLFEFLWKPTNNKK